MKNMTDMKDGHKKKDKILKHQTLSAVNAGPPDTDSLYYPLNVEGVNQKCSFLPAHKR